MKKLSNQSGAALLVLMLVLIIGSSYMLVTRLNPDKIRLNNQNQTMLSLAKAKEALIAYALIYYDVDPAGAGKFGVLPCPDVNPAINTEGSSDPNCSGQHINSVGKLPWRALGLPSLRDASGECLWYAVSGLYKENTSSDMLNEDSHGTFRIFASDGTTLLAGNSADDRPVAVIIAPGRTINNQDRSTVVGAEVCGGNYVANNYLDEDTTNAIFNHTLNVVADNVDDFVSANDVILQSDAPDILDDLNDVIVYITHDDIFNAIKRRTDYEAKLFDDAAANNLTKKITECLAGYMDQNRNNHGADVDLDGLFNQSLPWPAPMDLVDYRDDSEYTDRVTGAGFLAGRLPIIINDSNDEIYTGCSEPPQTCAPPVDNLMTFCEGYWVGSMGLSLDERDELIALWQNWKDHLFYVVSQQYQPKPIDEDIVQCGGGQYCVTTDDLWTNGGTQDWSAIVFFAGETLAGKSRTEEQPPPDLDTKFDITNYMEDENTSAYDDGDNNQYYKVSATTGTFNDILYCIQDDDTGGGVNAFEAGLCVP